MARRLASRLAWVSITPFGLPVLPEVYWMNAKSWLPTTGHGPLADGRRRSSTVTTWRRDRVWARR